MKTRRYNIKAILLILGGLTLISACNSKDDESSGAYVSSESVAITGFKLSPNISIMKNLDSVYFSIDLEHGVVFNADSLPKGTKITKLIPKISYPSTVTAATITMSGGTNRVGTVDYYNSPNDTIDFTGKVTLELKAGNISKTYLLKVNVHNVEADTIIWDNTAVAGTLPSRMPTPKAQKTVISDGSTVCLIEESDGSLTLSTSSDLFTGSWDKKAIEAGFSPDIDTFTATNGEFYMLSEEGNLYKSADAEQWEDCGVQWSNIIGGYDNYLLGLIASGSDVSTVSYPEGLTVANLPANFPAWGYSKPIVNKSAWASNPVLMIFGGESVSGDYCNGAWAFDGTKWTNLADRLLPAMYGVDVFPYYTYLSASTGGEREISNLVAMGGRMADGSINRDVYISYNNGLSWVKGADYLQLPSVMEIGERCDIVTFDKPMEWDLSNNWKAIGPRRIKYEIDGDMVKWNCPYIFIFGGYREDGSLIEDINCGVLRRLTFAPLF